MAGNVIFPNSSEQANEIDVNNNILATAIMKTNPVEF